MTENYIKNKKINTIQFTGLGDFNFSEEKEINNARDNCLEPFLNLYKKLLKKNIKLIVTNQKSINCDLTIHLNPKLKEIKRSNNKNIFIRWEPPNVRPDLWNNKKLFQNRSLISWHFGKDEIIKNKLLQPFPISIKHRIKSNIDLKKITNNKFPRVCMVNACKFSINKKNNHLDGYKLRMKILKEAYEINEHISLFGYGWKKEALNHFDLLRLIHYKSYISYIKDFGKIQEKTKFLQNFYKGIIEKKSSLYNNYDFMICIENYFHKNYITEKIFECLKYGIIPIYIGSPMVKSLIPNDLFIFIPWEDANFENIRSHYLNFIEKNDDLMQKKVEISNWLNSLKIFELGSFDEEKFSENIIKFLFKVHNQNTLAEENI